MTTRMQHPNHGWTHAYTPQEIKRLEQLGWSVEKLSIPGEQVAPAEAPQKKKPGPKPKAK